MRGNNSLERDETDHIKSQTMLYLVQKQVEMWVVTKFENTVLKETERSAQVGVQVETQRDCLNDQANIA